MEEKILAIYSYLTREVAACNYIAITNACMDIIIYV